MKGTIMSDPRSSKAGLGALLTPDNCVLILIDHQPFQFAGLRSHDAQTVINNVVGLAKSAKVFGVPTLLTTVLERQGGVLIRELQEVFPEQKPIDRTFINTWEDARVVDWVKKTGRQKVVMAALWTEICLAMPAIQALGEGYEVFIVTDASGGVTVEAHEMGIQRMVQAGAVPITWMVLAAELQRDWARTATVPDYAQMLAVHSGAVGTSFLWEQQLLNTPSESKAKKPVGV
jgi:nicotinamidase-related amidase